MLTRNPRYKAWWGAVLEAAKGAPRLEGEHSMAEQPFPEVQEESTTLSAGNTCSGNPFYRSPVTGQQFNTASQDIYTVEFKIATALDAVHYALNPDPCCECGHGSGIDHEELQDSLRGVREVMAQLPQQTRKEMKKKLYSLFDGQNPPQIDELMSHEELTKTATWLAEHLKQQADQAGTLLQAAASAVNLIEEGNPDEARDVLCEALEWEDIDPKEIDQT